MILIKNKLSVFLLFLLTGKLMAQLGTTTVVVTGMPAAVQTYVARDLVKLSGNGKLVANATPSRMIIDKNIVAPINVNGNPYAGYSVSNVYAIDKNLPVGYVNGSYGVNSGQLGYSIPITVAPGTAGMTPDVSLVYNSSQSDGIAGIGWGIGGISVITRVPRKYFYQLNNQIAGNSVAAEAVSLSNTDDLTLDGNLIASNIGAATPNIRRLENDNFTEVNCISVSGVYDHFEVTTKDGIFMEYGTVPNARLMINNPATGLDVALSYYLYKVTDKNGNYYTYHYYNQNGEVALQEIQYTGNSNAGITPYNSIKFYYDSRQDPSFYYFKGTKLNSTLILREIEMFCEQTSFKKIVPTYDYMNDNTYLSSVTEYGADNTHLNPTKFSYDNPAYAFTPGSLNLGPVNSIPRMADYAMGDFNGDGKTDVMAYTYNAIDQNTGTKIYTGWKLFINTDNGTNYTQVATSGSGFYCPYSMYGYTPGSLNADGNNTGDLNGDGKEDILILTSNGSTMSSFMPLYSNFTGVTGSFTQGATFSVPIGSQIKLADIDGDKRPELIAIGNLSGSTYVYVYNFENNTMQSKSCIYNNIAQVIDFDNDDTKELLIEHASKSKVVKITSYNKFQTTNPPSFALNEIANDNTVQSQGFGFLYADFNGDGITDRLIRNYNNATLVYGTGKQGATSFFTSYIVVAGVPGTQTLNKGVVLADMDNDGKTDIVVFSSVYYGDLSMNVIYGKNLNNNISIGTEVWTEFPNAPNVITPPTTFETNGNKLQEFRIGDFDGNGYTDIMLKVKMGEDYYGVRGLYHNKPINTDGKLSRVTNGFAKSIGFSYKTLVDPTIYTKGTGAAFPIIDVQAPIKVISSVSLTDVNENAYTIDYKYEDLKVHVTGKGFLGFGKVSISNNLTSTKSVTEYNLFNQANQNPCRYPISYKTYLLPNNPTTPIYQKNINYTYVKSFPYPITFNYYVKTDKITEIDIVKGTNVETDYVYDNFLNTTVITTNINSGYQINKITNTIDNTNLYGNKYPSFITSVATEQTRASETTINIPIKNKYVYNTTNGDLISVTNNFGQPCENSTNYTYYATGMIHTTTDNSNGNVPRINTFNYDIKSRFAIKSTNTLGYFTQTTYDSRFGTPLIQVDITNKNTYYTYDGFGKNTSIATPDNKTVYIIQKWTDSNDDLANDPFPVTNGLITKKIIGANRPTEFSIYNSSGLVIKKNIESINQIYVSNRIAYNNEGLVSSTKDSYNVPCTNPNLVLTSTNNYDLLKRITLNTVTDGVNQKNTSFAYSQGAGGYYIVTATDPNGKTKRTITDATGNIESVTDNLNGILTYKYYSDGQHRHTVLNGNIVLASTYDACGNISTQDEPNHGLTNFTFDGFNQLISKTNNSKTYTNLYDELGRLTNSTGPEGAYTYQYITSGNGLGLIEQITAPNGVFHKYYYDNLNRTTKFEKNINGQNFANQYEYDQYSNPIKHIYPSGFTTKMSYNNLGLLTTIKNDATNGLIWQGDELNSKGLYTKYTLGNSIQSTRTFDNFGQINSEVAGNVFDHNYDFNIYNGNLNSLNDNIKGLKETYTYDGLDRLKSSTVGDAFGPLLTPLTLTYDLAGNITNKSDVGDFKYLSTKPNAVQFVKNPNNIISQIQQDITYTAFEKASVIIEGDEQATITYGPNQERVKTDFSNSLLGTSSTRYYLNDYEKEVKTGMTREMHYINAPSGLVAMHVIENGVANTYFTYNDHLGTPKTITNANGNVVAEQNFDPWGQRRNPNTWDYNNVPAPPAWLFRGYTGHEHLPQFSLINMNGRMYDPQNARMLSADPILHDATSTQAYNKYSYCINNPLKYTDPSGYDFKLKGKNNDFVFYAPFTKSTGSSWRDDPTVVKGSNGMPIGGNGKEYSNFGDFGFNVDDGDNVYVNSKLPGLSTFLIQGYDHHGKYSSFTTTDKKVARLYNGPNFIDKDASAWFMADVTEISNEDQSNGVIGAISNVVGGIGMLAQGAELSGDLYMAKRTSDFYNAAKFALHPNAMNPADKAPLFANRLMSGSKLMNVAKYAKGIGIIGNAAGMAISAGNILSGKGTVMDGVDFGVNAVGIATTLFLASNPIGWVIGGASIIYGGVRLYQELSKP